MPLGGFSGGTGPLPHPASPERILRGGRVGERAGAAKCGETAFSKKTLNRQEISRRKMLAGW